GAGARDLRRAGAAPRGREGFLMATPRGPRRLSRAASSGGVKPGCVQAWIELRSDDPEAVSALAVARARVGGGQALLGLRRLRLFELSGTLPATRAVEAPLHRSTWSVNPHKERC